MPSRSLGSALYFVTFIDDATRKVWVFVMKLKDEVLMYFKKFIALVETRSNKKVKSLRSNNGGEYIFREFFDFCKQRGIKKEFTALYTPAQNGVVERMNCTIQERILSMLLQANLPQGFWAEALHTTVYLINWSLNTKLNFKILEEAWTRRKLLYKQLWTFDCEAYAHVPKDLRAKLDFNSKKSIFVVAIDLTTILDTDYGIQRAVT